MPRPEVQQAARFAGVRQRALQVVLPGRHVPLLGRDEVGHLLHGVPLAGADVDRHGVHRALIAQDQGPGHVVLEVQAL